MLSIIIQSYVKEIECYDISELTDIVEDSLVEYNSSVEGDNMILLSIQTHEWILIYVGDCWYSDIELNSALKLLGLNVINH